MLKKLYAIITADSYDTKKNHFELRKEMLIRVFLHITTFILVFFTLVNFFVYHKYLLAGVELIASLISIFALMKLKNPKTLQKAIVISSTNIFIFFLFYLFVNQNVDNGLIWTIFLPIFIIPLNGHKEGLYISLFFYAIVFIVAYMGIGVWQHGVWNFHSYMRFVLASLVLVYITYITELAIYRSNVLLSKKEAKEIEYIQKLKEMSQKDYLTSLYNRRETSDLLAIEMKKFHRYDNAMALAIIDIDFFKNINDTYGHNRGDSVLVSFAQQLRDALRETDIVGRWGGEEFLIVFTHTDIKDAFKKCETLRKMIENKVFEEVGSVTCSIGLAAMEEGMDQDSLIEKADKALYEAKNNGRNRVYVCK